MKKKLCDSDIRYLIRRLKLVVELLRSNEPTHRHMAAAKLLADISVLKGTLKNK